jgi:hypothetical protein
LLGLGREWRGEEAHSQAVQQGATVHHSMI